MAETDTRVLEFLEEGLFLYGVGKVQEAIQRWRKVLELDPRNERALDYIESAGGDVSAFRRNMAAAPAPAPAPFAAATTPGVPSFTPAPTPPPPMPPPMPPPQPAAANPFAGFGPSAAPAAPAPFRPPAPQPPPMVAPQPAPQPVRPAPFAQQPAESRDDLIRKAGALYRAQQFDLALEILERIAREFPPLDDTVRGYLDAARNAVLANLRGQWSQMDKVPRPRISPAQVMQMNLTPECGFLLSRIDGVSSLEDILAISGIEELTALRALTTLVQRGVIELA